MTSYDRGDVKQEMLDAFRTIVDAYRAGSSTSNLGFVAQSVISPIVAQSFTDKEKFLFNTPTAKYTRKAVPVLVSTQALVDAGKTSTDNSSPRQKRIQAELGARFGKDEAAEMVNDKKAQIKKQIEELNRLFATL